MTDEEKEAIEYIRNCLDDEYNFKNATRFKDLKAFKIVLNLIEKQSIEIEELNLKNIELKQSKIVDKNSIPNQDNFYDCYNYISKDKIKAKIEEVENMTLVEIAEKVEGHTYYLSLDGLSEGKKIASYFIQSLLEEKE